VLFPDEIAMRQSNRFVRVRVGSWICCLAGIVIAGAGCGDGGPRYVPVSGVVKLDGKLYGEAVVVFSPIGTGQNPNPGQTSSAETDAAGRFVLKTADLKTGAVAGKHLVRIQTRVPVLNVDRKVGTPDNSEARVKRDPIPAEWNTLSHKEYDVPSKGTDQANFDITTGK
jgi:hypothetical protein